MFSNLDIGHFNHPALVFLASLILMWSSVQLGRYLNKKGEMEDRVRQEFNLVLGATLSLLGLIIGFSFSMAISRYDQRKNYEEAEANAIGTEYVRAGLLPATDAASVRELLKKYLEQRFLFYQTRDLRKLDEIGVRTTEIQNALWSAVQTPAEKQPTPVVALAVSGMNDVLNSQGYTQAAWWNRIPTAAWLLMELIAICSNLLIGFGGRRSGAKGSLFAVLPVLVSISFLLIADIDSPRGGIIRVRAQNLESLAQSLPR
jgi:hypothetical protein